MSPPAGEAFDTYASGWAEWQERPWAQLRYRLVAFTLDRVLSSLGRACRVLDVGGGDGADSVRLAHAGHEVTVLDPSEVFLRRALAAATAAGVATRVRTVRSSVESLEPGEAGESIGRFDLVLCHNVLQYLADVDDAVRRLVGVLRPGGALSLLAPNPAMDVFAEAVRNLEPGRARAVVDAPTVRSLTFGLEMRRLEPHMVEEALRTCGLEVAHRFGIRCVSDLIVDDDLKSDPAFARDLELLERELCDREPYVRTARYWQLVAVRAPAAEDR